MAKKAKTPAVEVKEKEVEAPEEAEEVLFGEEDRVSNFFTALAECPDWYQYLLGTIVAASFGFRGAAKFMGKK